MLTRKHYEEMAHTIAVARSCYPWMDMRIVLDIAHGFADMAKKENPRFDRQKFLRAAACPETFES